MKSAASFLMTGIVHEGDFRLPLPVIPHSRVKRLVKLIMIGAVLAAGIHAGARLMPLVTFPLQGQWLDEALSEVLTRRYDCPVAFKNVRIRSFHEIGFDALYIGTRDYKLLIKTGKGRALLRRWSPRKGLLFEAHVSLEDVNFTKTYYRDSPAFRSSGFIGAFMHKPLVVRRMKIEVIQKEGSASVRILEAESKDVEIEGSLEMKGSKVARDGILASFSPIMMLRALLPEDRPV